MDGEPTYVPYPNDPWNEIVPGLFQGGQVTTQYWKDGSFVKVGSEFDAVYSFYWNHGPEFGPDPGVPHLHYPIPDGELESQQLLMIRSFAVATAMAVRNEKKILIRCQAGYNRSGLVTAFTLMELGYKGWEAVGLIRRNRSPHALHNQTFLRYLREADGGTP